MKKVMCVGALVLLIILGCSRPSSNPTSSDENWWGSPDPDATWISVSDYCSYRVPATQDAADSICQHKGYYRSSGYEDDACYVGGEKRIYLSRVACSVD